MIEESGKEKTKEVSLTTDCSDREIVTGYCDRDNLFGRDILNFLFR